MMKFSQFEILSEGFWNTLKTPLRVAGGIAGAAVKGGASVLRKIAPELTNPIDKFEADARDVGNQIRQGYDIGSGGLQKAYKDILLDAGYIMSNKGVTPSGKNKVVTGFRIIGNDPKTGKPIGDTSKELSFIFNKANQFNIINTSTQNTSKLNMQKPHKYKSGKKNSKKNKKKTP